MERDEIIEMANQAGFQSFEEGELQSPYVEDTDILFMLEDFAKLVASAAIVKEREACAKLCEELDSASYPYVVVFPDKCAAAIRQRGKYE